MTPKESTAVTEPCVAGKNDQFTNSFSAPIMTEAYGFLIFSLVLCSHTPDRSKDEGSQSGVERVCGVISGLVNC